MENPQVVKEERPLGEVGTEELAAEIALRLDLRYGWIKFKVNEGDVTSITHEHTWHVRDTG